MKRAHRLVYSIVYFIANQMIKLSRRKPIRFMLLVFRLIYFILFRVAFWIVSFLVKFQMILRFQIYP